jgi:hypothetical protein
MIFVAGKVSATYHADHTSSANIALSTPVGTGDTPKMNNHI